MEQILESPCSEALINLDADGIGRIFSAGEAANHEALLNDIFGDASWKDVLHQGDSLSQQCHEVLNLYKDKLRALHGVSYVFSFEMRSGEASLNYYLVFASKHPLGLEKMKEAMRKMDQDGSYRFCDTSIGQSPIFRFDDPKQYSLQLHDKFKGERVLYAVIRDYTLNETPFSNPSSMLTYLEKQDAIAVDYSSPNRRKGQFAPEKTRSVTFKEKIPPRELSLEGL